MQRNSGCRVSLSPGFYLQCALLVLLLPLQWVLALGVSAAMHELGHIAALRWMKVPVYKISFVPSGVILETPPVEMGKELLCAAAGPLSGLCLVFLFRLIPELALFALFHSLYNLLPVYPADGGRILLVLCHWILPRKKSEKVAKVISEITMVLLVCIGIYGTFFAKLGLLPITVGVGLCLRTLKKLK